METARYISLSAHVIHACERCRLRRVSPRHSSGHLPLMCSPSIFGFTYVNATFEPRTELRSSNFAPSLSFVLSVYFVFTVCERSHDEYLNIFSRIDRDFSDNLIRYRRFERFRFIPLHIYNRIFFNASIQVWIIFVSSSKILIKVILGSMYKISFS